MPQRPAQLAVATSLLPAPSGLIAQGESASPADFSPSLAQAAVPGVLALDSLLGKSGFRLAAAGIAYRQLLGTETRRAHARGSGRITSGAGALQKYLVPPPPPPPASPLHTGTFKPAPSGSHRAGQ